MSLVEIARFPTLPQAEAAASALNGGGFRAEVFNRNIAVTYWMWNQANGGPRLFVPAAHVQAARDFLAACEPKPFEPLQPRARFFLMPILVLLVGCLGSEASWIAAGAYVRAQRQRASAVAEQMVQ